MSYEVQLSKDQTQERVSSDTQSEMLEKSVNILVDEFDLLDRIELPKVMRDRAILNSQPKHPNGTEMSHYAEITEDCYLFLNLPLKSKKSQIKKLSEICGVSAQFED